MAFRNRVFYTPDSKLVFWDTALPDPTGVSYPGPGTFGDDTTSYVVIPLSSAGGDALQRRIEYIDPIDDTLPYATEVDAASFIDLFDPIPIKYLQLEANKITFYDFSAIADDYPGGPWVWPIQLPVGTEGDVVVLVQKPFGGVNPTFIEGGGYVALGAGTIEDPQTIDDSGSPTPWMYLQTKYVVYGIRMYFKWVYQNGSWRTKESRFIGGAFLLGSAGFIGSITLSEGTMANGNVLTFNGGSASFQPVDTATIPADGAPEVATLRTLGDGSQQAYPGNEGAATAGNVGTLQTQMSTAQGDIGTLQGEMSTAQGDISTLQSDVAALQSASGLLGGYTSTPATLDGTQEVWDIDPQAAGGTMNLTLPALTSGFNTYAVDIRIRNSANTVNFLRPGGTGFINDVASDLAVPGLAVYTLYRFINTSFNQLIFKIGTYAP